MKNFIDNLTGKIVTSKFLKKVKAAFASLKTQPIVTDAQTATDEYVKKSTPSNPFDTFGSYVADKVKKLFKHFGKKFKNEKEASNVITKTVSVVSRIVCTIATIAFGGLVIYAFIKLIPTLIYMMAIFTAIYIGIELISIVLERGLHVN